MKVVTAFLFISGVQAFTPPLHRVSHPTTTTARSFAPLDAFSDLPQQISSMQDAFVSSSTFLADAAAEAATEVAKNDNGWFGFLTGPIMFLLQLIHAGLVAVGVSSNAWGVSIIAITLLIKAVTFPLTKTQLESTNKMQAMQPAIKELQAKYQSNPEVMNQKIAEFYQSNDINPLAGCLPSLAQIPIFIGLYRAVLDLAQENKLNEPFLWLPNLEGPTYGADPTSGSDWLFKGWCV
jgi:YidC/Oxa1 family membrane protein insertase